MKFSGVRLAITLTLIVLTLAAVLLLVRGSGAFDGVHTPRYTAQGVIDCLQCHFGSAMEGVAAGPHGNSDNPDTPYSRQGCESCHGPGSFHASRAYGGTGVPPLRAFSPKAKGVEREAQQQACEQCHQTTRDDHPLQRGQPIDFEQQACSECHTIHAAAAEEDPWSW